MLPAADGANDSQQWQVTLGEFLIGGNQVGYRKFPEQK